MCWNPLTQAEVLHMHMHTHFKHLTPTHRSINELGLLFPGDDLDPPTPISGERNRSGRLACWCYGTKSQGWRYRDTG